MSLPEKIIQTVKLLPESKQIEILDFVECLRLRTEKEEEKDWTDFSLSSAMRGMEDEKAHYSMGDLKETF